MLYYREYKVTFTSRLGKTHPRPLPKVGEKEKKGKLGDTPKPPAGEYPCTPLSAGLLTYITADRGVRNGIYPEQRQGIFRP
jgi:hypothetical protein